MWYNNKQYLNCWQSSLSFSKCPLSFMASDSLLFMFSLKILSSFWFNVFFHHCERSCSLRSALMKKRSFRGNSLTSTGMASYSSLSML